MLGLSPEEQNAIMTLRQNQQQIGNKSINDIISTVQRNQALQSAERRHGEALNLKERQFAHQQELDNIKNIFELKKSQIAESNLSINRKNALTRQLAQRSLHDWQDSQIKYNEEVRGYKTEVFEEPDGTFKVYYTRGNKKFGEPIRTATNKDLGKSNKDSVKVFYSIQKELDKITLDDEGEYVYPTNENIKHIKNFAKERGKDIEVLEIPSIDEGIMDIGSDKIRIPFIVDSDGIIDEETIRDTLENKYNWRLPDIDQAIKYLKQQQK